ncbi:hypothetical protein [Spiroplasma diminutum]|uniref:Uncharacterized protein n=1 Tax=Spiroplasma diminutum CUAS-1 TaxID=1276221 RepID=S5LWV6_9MOLU|nr:hypothetical protein [Spiroplasma diminutum]AGR42264.1 hypothetical protein SDIMI_v3c05600 [Spiroplasma diminutum CUAS-1]
MWILGILLALSWISVFAIPGCFIARKGYVWGLLLATIGLALVGSIIAFCLYETWKRNEEKNKNENLISWIATIDEKVSDISDKKSV